MIQQFAERLGNLHEREAHEFQAAKNSDIALAFGWRRRFSPSISRFWVAQRFSAAITVLS